MKLSKPDLQRFKSLLMKLKQTLLNTGETGEQAEEIVELDQARVGRLSRMDAMQAQAMSKETGRRRRQYLVEIDAALKRIVDGVYGECLDCDKPVHPGRLTADPAARLCITCAQARE